MLPTDSLLVKTRSEKNTKRLQSIERNCQPQAVYFPELSVKGEGEKISQINKNWETTTGGTPKKCTGRKKTTPNTRRFQIQRQMVKKENDKYVGEDKVTVVV